MDTSPHLLSREMPPAFGRGRDPGTMLGVFFRGAYPVPAAGAAIWAARHDAASSCCARSSTSVRRNSRGPLTPGSWVAGVMSPFWDMRTTVRPDFPRMRPAWVLVRSSSD